MHQGSDYLALNPLGKVPVLVEQEDGQNPSVLTQSNAIILYVADNSAGYLVPENERDRTIVLECFFFFVTDIIAVSHAAFSLRGLNTQETKTILTDRVLATLESAERYVGQDEFIAGKTFSAADIAGFTITLSVKSELQWANLPNLRRWFEQIESRPAVKRGL